MKGKPTRKGKGGGKPHTNRRIDRKERMGAGRTFRGDKRVRGNGIGREVEVTDGFRG